ncbi:MAG: BON domain-containing protein [Chloroflexi bacterium]|nr:BON domain-containing protein [Chloroflexota bacterium]
MAIRHSRPDAEVERYLRDLIYADVRLNAENIQIEVSEGVALLRGSVPNSQQRALARDISNRIKGVRRVVNELEVVPAGARSDADITADVVSALTVDSLVDEDKIDVTTVDRVVHMEGTVNTYVERKAAYDDARQVSGVIDVINEVMVIPSYAHDDEEVRRNVRHQIQDNLRLDPFSIDVQVRHGIVRLRGSVATVEQRWIVGDLARWTPGVIDVTNDLVVAVERSA